jgi:integrase
VTKLTAADIDDVYAYLLRRGGRDDRPLSPGTVHRVHVVLHRALTQAVRWEWIWSNPAAFASPPRVEPAEIRPPSVEQVRQLLDVVGNDDPDFFTYLHLAVMTGARRSQLLAMRWSDVDFDHAAIGLSRALVEGPSGPVLRPTKTGAPTGWRWTREPLTCSSPTASAPVSALAGWPTGSCSLAMTAVDVRGSRTG